MATDNSERARTLFRLADDGRAGAGECIEAIERELNLAEDRGGERAAQLPSADPLTVEALRGMVRELLEPIRSTWVSGPELDHRAAAIVQVIIANFHIRLIDEVTAEMERPARKCQDCGLGESACLCHDESETGHDSSEAR